MGSAVNVTTNVFSYKEYFNKPTVSLDVSMHVSQSAILMVTHQFQKSVQDMSGYEPDDITVAFATDSLANLAPNITFG